MLLFPYMTTMAAASDDKAAIRALEEKFSAAFNAGDIDGIMQNYVQDESLVVFDVVPRKQSHGADAYRKDWHAPSIAPRGRQPSSLFEDQT